LNTTDTSRDVLLEPADNQRLANLCGQFDEHLRQIERRLKVSINNRGNRFRVSGSEAGAETCAQVLERLFALSEDESIDPERVHICLQEAGMDPAPQVSVDQADPALIRTRRRALRARGQNQVAYIASIRQRDLTFGIGPAGTGKTYLAVACAVEALEAETVRRIVLVRPAVEAGERLGFLPGDMSQKVDPYLRPMYDALYDTMGFERVGRLIERNVIEVAPLAFMRGRSLNDAFVILDEAQNTSIEQMKMFLTRIGFGSRAVVTGDITQTDLPKGQASGLSHVIRVLAGIDEIGFCHFTARDVVRHPLVQTIVQAYEAFAAQESVPVQGGPRADPRRG
jgi:phosphate starvation-inducible protein PhoH and related proteins